MITGDLSKTYVLNGEKIKFWRWRINYNWGIRTKGSCCFASENLIEKGGKSPKKSRIKEGLDIGILCIYIYIGWRENSKESYVWRQGRKLMKLRWEKKEAHLRSEDYVRFRHDRGPLQCVRAKNKNVKRFQEIFQRWWKESVTFYKSWDCF
jgi:hypothetical protein